MTPPRKTKILRTYAAKKFNARKSQSKETHHSLTEASEPFISSNPDLASIDTNVVASSSSQRSRNKVGSTINVNEPEKMHEVWFTMSQSELQNLGLHAEIREGKAVITSTVAQPVSGLEKIIYEKLQQSSSKASERKQPLPKHRVSHTPVEPLLSGSKKSDKVATDTSVGITTIVPQVKQEASSVNLQIIKPKEMELEGQSAELENQSIEKIIEKWGSTSGYVRRYQAILYHHWEKSLEQIGYIRCPMQDCNYISLSREDMTNHYVSCKSIPQFDKYMCPHCMKRLGTNQDLKKHIRITHVSFPVGSDPEESNTDNRSIPDTLRDAILPRRRSFGKVHRKSWTIALEKQGFVKCIFRNCSYLALTLDEMTRHYGGCRADGMVYPATCKYCKGGMETEEKLMEHLAISHKNECMAELSVSENKEQCNHCKSSEEENELPESSNAFLLSVSTNEEGTNQKMELVSLPSLKEEEIEIEDLLMQENESNSLCDVGESFFTEAAKEAFHCGTNVPERSKPAQANIISNSSEEFPIIGKMQTEEVYMSDISRKLVPDKHEVTQTPLINPVEDTHVSKSLVEASDYLHIADIQKHGWLKQQYSIRSTNESFHVKSHRI